MAKTPTNSHKPWDARQNQTLSDLARENTPTRVIGLKMGRSENAIRAQASDLSVSLKPTNQSPYGTRKR